MKDIIEISKYDEIRDGLWEIEKSVDQVGRNLLMVIAKINKLEEEEEKNKEISHGK